MRVAILRMADMRAEPRVTKAAAALASAGHSVTVFALEDVEAAAPHVSQRWKLERVAPPGTASWRRPFAKMAEMRKRNRAFIRAVLAFRPDVVHAVDTDTLSIADIVSSIRGIPLVYEAAELYPDMLVSNRASTPSLVLAFWRRTERRLVPNADAVITVGDALAGELRSRFKVDAIAVRSVPPLADEATLDRRRLRVQLGLGADRLLVLYQGLVNRGRGLEPLLKAIAGVPQSNLVVQGHGPFADEFLEQSRRLKLADRVHYMGLMPMDELTMWASGADVGTVLIENLSLNNYLSAPNKLYQYLMAGVALLGSDFPEIGSVIREGDCGLVCDPSDVDAIAAALRQLVALGPEGRAAMGARARHLAESTYNWDLEKQKLLEVYDRLAARSTS